MIKKDDGDISVKPNPGEGENKPSTGGDGTGTGTEGETKPELDTYVSGIQDYEIKVGEDIDTSSISYNAEHISSVELDSSKVDNTTVGTYTISYIIKGIDGRVKTIDKQCVVIENSELTALRAEMCAKADVLFEGKFTEQAYAAEWNAALDEAKARINKLGTSDAEKMQGIVDELTKTGQDILDRQQLYIAQTGYVKILKEYYSSLKFETDSQKKMADETLNAAVDKISKATSIDAASKALEDAKAALKDIAEQKETTLDELKEAAKAEINDKAKVINDSTSITSDVKNAFILKIDSCTDSQKKMADETLNAAVDKISKATSIDAASKALEDAKAALKDIAEQKETTLDELKEAAKAEINDKAKVINDSTSITSDVKNAFILKIDSCTDAKAIESAKNSADAAFTDVVAAVGGDMASFVNLFKDLKGISPDGDTTAMIDVVINLGAPKDMKDGANRVEDVCIALANSAEQFIKYLNVCAGQEVKGKTKAEAYASYMELTNGNPERKELEKAKKAAKEELDKAIDAIDDSTEEIKKKKASVKEDVHNLIDKSESMNDLDANLKSAKEAVDALIKEVQGEGELKDLKEAAKIQIQSVVDDQKDEKLKAILQDIATPALEKIDAAKTQEEITSILEAYQKDIQTAIDTYAKDKELAAAQAAAVKKLATLESKAKADYVTEDMKKIITTAKEEIQKAKTVDDVTKLYNQAKSDYNTAYVTSMRAVYEKKLDALLTDNKFTDATYLEKAKEVVTKQKANLKQAANEATMQEVYKVAKENVEKLVTAQSTAANLAQVKTNAVQSLQNGYPNPSSATTKILEKYINKINSATSETEVNDIVQECKDVLKKTGIDYDNNNGGGNNGGDSNVTPTPGIDSDVTPTPSNSATPNGGTTTTLPGGSTGTGSTGTGASQKGTSDVSAAGNVKTGDENMGIIAMAGAAILAAIAAAGISLRKFLKKDE